MSQFTTNFRGELIGNNLWSNLESFEYHVNTYPSDEIISVPVGFVTDFTSVPRLFWPILAPTDRYAKAAVIHDFCYCSGLYSRKRADEIFREALIVLKIEPWKIWVLYTSVRMCGWHRYNELRKKEMPV